MTIKQLLLPIILFLIALAIVIVASLFKIMHWMFASELLIIGMSLKVIAIIILIFKLFQFNRKE